jgi:hypothetical protein
MIGNRILESLAIAVRDKSERGRIVRPLVVFAFRLKRCYLFFFLAFFFAGIAILPSILHGLFCNDVQLRLSNV